MDVREILKTLYDEHVAYERHVEQEVRRSGVSEDRVRDAIGTRGDALTELPAGLEQVLQEWVWNHMEEAADFLKR